MSNEKIRTYLIANILDKLVLYVMEDEHCDEYKAMSKVYESPIIKWLEDPEDNLRAQSPAYVYELLKRTIR